MLSVAGVLDEPYIQLILLSRVALPASQATYIGWTLDSLCRLAPGWPDGYSAERA